MFKWSDLSFQLVWCFIWNTSGNKNLRGLKHEKCTQLGGMCVFPCALEFECVLGVDGCLLHAWAQAENNRQSFHSAHCEVRRRPRRRRDVCGIRSYLVLHIQSLAAWWKNYQKDKHVFFLYPSSFGSCTHSNKWGNWVHFNLSVCDCCQQKYDLTPACKLLIHLPCLFCALSTPGCEIKFNTQWPSITDLGQSFSFTRVELCRNALWWRKKGKWLCLFIVHFLFLLDFFLEIS